MSNNNQLKKIDSSNESVYSVQSTLQSIKSKSSKVLSSLKLKKNDDVADNTTVINHSLPDAVSSAVAVDAKRRSSELSITSNASNVGNAEKNAANRPQTDRERRVSATTTYLSLKS